MSDSNPQLTSPSRAVPVLYLMRESDLVRMYCKYIPTPLSIQARYTDPVGSGFPEEEPEISVELGFSVPFYGVVKLVVYESYGVGTEGDDLKSASRELASQVRRRVDSAVMNDRNRRPNWVAGYHNCGEQNPVMVSKQDYISGHTPIHREEGNG